jgi:hypothetical protein
MIKSSASVKGVPSGEFWKRPINRLLVFKKNEDLFVNLNFSSFPQPQYVLTNFDELEDMATQ